MLENNNARTGFNILDEHDFMRVLNNEKPNISKYESRSKNKAMRNSSFMYSNNGIPSLLD